MKSIICILCASILLFEIISASPLERFFRVKRQYLLSSTAVGSIRDASYHGVGSNPNYGSFIAKADRANSGIIPISYDSNSGYYSNMVRQNRANWQQRPNSNVNNNNNKNWQNWNRNSYNRYNQYDNYNRYAPGSQGWYATGGNYWFNNAQSILLRPYLFIVCLAIVLFWK